MTNPDEMTPAEHAAVLAAIEADLPVRMVRPDGRVVPVIGRHVQERLDAGYTIAQPDAGQHTSE
ncbi:hypothetical protein [Dactylosporangium sp. NPDC051484]|uniref:hypothetical protein n=1 Tax=Dactylosporangium sp. NPDC051484 TaxID=3154942 RepID=UPI00344ED654